MELKMILIVIIERLDITETYRRFDEYLAVYADYPISLDRCYLFTKKMLNMELKLILVVFLETLNIPGIYDIFDEYVATVTDDDFDSLFVGKL